MALRLRGPGRGRDKGKIGATGKATGRRRRCNSPGALFGRSQWAAYRDADVFVLPSQNENFGNTAAEAVAAGTPVVVTEQCEVAALRAEEAGLVVPYDAEALSRALERILG